MNEQINKDKHHYDQHVIDLLNGSIDGELNSKEQAELDQLMAGSEKVRDLCDELRAIGGLLDQAPEHEPPEYLQSVIEKQIRLPVADKSPDGKRGIVSNWLHANWIRTGFALAAGVVLTVGVYEMGNEPITGQDSASLVGTVVKNPASIQGELLSTILLEKDTLNGHVELRSQDELFVLDLRLSSVEPSEVVVNFAGRGLIFEDITPKQDTDGAIKATDGSITVASHGEQHYTMRFRRTSESVKVGPLELEFFNNNKKVHEAELNVSGN